MYGDMQKKQEERNTFFHSHVLQPDAREGNSTHRYLVTVQNLNQGEMINKHLGIKLKASNKNGGTLWI